MVEWITSDGLTDYAQAVEFMETRAEAIHQGTAEECIWLVEHPPLYTAGTSAKPADLVAPDRFPVHQSKRGGQYTYHGPGQRVAYVMLDVGKRGRDVRCFVRDLEQWVINTLAEFNVKGEIRQGRVGVWVQRDDKPLGPTGQPQEDKIGALGIRLRKMGQLPRAFYQRGTRPRTFQRDHPMRHHRTRRHVAGGSGPAGDDGRRRRRPAPDL